MTKHLDTTAVYVWCINTSDAVYLQDVEYNLFSSRWKSGRNTPKLWKMLHHQGCQPRALSHLPQSLWAGASDSRSATSRCHERRQTRGNTLHTGTDTPWNHRLVSKNAPSAFFPILDPRWTKQGRSAASQAMAVWCERSDGPPLIFPSSLHLPHASEVIRYLTAM